MVGYIETLIVLTSNMMALAAVDATFTSTLHVQSLPLTLRNTAVAEFPENHNADTLFTQPFSASTDHLIQLCIEDSMVNNGDTSSHHDSGHQLVDLAGIQCNITHTGTILHALIATLSPPPMQTTIPAIALHLVVQNLTWCSPATTA